MSRAPSTALGPGGEFDLIRRLSVRWGGLAVGLGDDAAILDVPPGSRLVASTDSSVEEVHFRQSWMTLREIGFRSTTAALSDLAAMAADPVGLLVALSVPAGIAGRIEELADGIGDAAREAGCPIVGGDLTRSDQVSLTITALGAAAAPVGRNGASAGQAVFVTGVLGGPGAAVEALQRGTEVSPQHRTRLVHPVARLAEARWLADHGASAMIDISDGLAADARHLAAASGVTLSVDLDALPVMPGLDPKAAARSGEEYELLATAPDELDVAEFRSRHGLPLTRIGSVHARRADPPSVEFRQGPQRVDLAGGYDHFSP